jgi:hypothetical protein
MKKRIVIALLLFSLLALLLGAAPNDTCATPDVVTISPGQSVAMMGDTTGAADDVQVFCAKVAAPDVTYSMTITAPGTLTLSLLDAVSVPWNGAFSVRKQGCLIDGNADFCANLRPAGAGEVFKYAVEPGTYAVIVDGGDAGAAGQFTMTFALAAPVCGDGVRNPGEECDVGATSTDTCDATTCLFKPAAVPSLEACPGFPVAIAAGEDKLIGQFDTYNAHDDYNGACNHNYGGRDHVFQITPAASGTLYLDTGYDEVGHAYCNNPTCWMGAWDCPAGCWNRVLYTRSTCANAATETACDHDRYLTKYVTADLSIPVTAGVPVFAFVDSLSDNEFGFCAGPYYLHARLLPQL